MHAHPPDDDQTGALRAFSLTHVQYVDGDPLGFPVAAVTLTPVFVMVAYATLILSRRDLATVALCVGQLLNEGVNYALKHAIKEPRPVVPGAAALHAGAPKFGMPSDHAQFGGFLAAYLTAWAVRCWRAPAGQRALLVAGAHVAAVACAASRVYLGYHSAPQVLAGYAAGCVTGPAWYAVVQRVLRPLFPRLAASAWGRALQLRDATHVHDVLAVEYAAVSAAAAAAAGAAGKRASLKAAGGSGGGASAAATVDEEVDGYYVSPDGSGRAAARKKAK